MSVMESKNTGMEMSVECVPEERTYTVLLVDDEKFVRLVMKRRLANLHLRVLEAGNG